MIATLKAKRREVVKQIGELQKERQSLDVQISVASAEKRVKITEARRREIKVAKKPTPEHLRGIDNRVYGTYTGNGMRGGAA